MEDATRKYVPKSVRLMDQVLEVLHFHHYAYNTEKSYISWILQYIRFFNKKHSIARLSHGCNIYQDDLSICNILVRISLLNNRRARLSAC